MATDGFLYTMLLELCNISIGSEITDSLTQTLSSFDGTAHAQIVDLMRNSVFGIGASLLTLFMLIELASLMQRVDNDGAKALQIPFNVILKFGILAILFCNLPTILSAIQEIGADIGFKIGYAPATPGVGLDAGQIADLIAKIEDESFVSMIFIYLIIFVEWVIVHLLSTMIGVTITFRMFELWLMLLFAPIPLATIGSSEFKSTAFNFLKSFTAVSIQGAVIIGCFKIYELVVSSHIETWDTSQSASYFAINFLTKNIVYIVVLGISVFSSGKIAKSIMGAI